MQDYPEKRVCLHCLLVTSVTVSNKPRNNLIIFIVHWGTSEKYKGVHDLIRVVQNHKGITLFFVNKYLIVLHLLPFERPTSDDLELWVLLYSVVRLIGREGLLFLGVS